ncbi:MAG: collagen-like protein [Rhodoluna sp.]|nr:collagen-like protein [Rhodoluna sp.]
MRKVNALAAVAVIIAASAISGVVASNAASTTIYGCLSKAGALTKVSTKAHTCPKATTKIKWGVTGATGAVGYQGAIGAQGPEGPAGADGAQGPAGADGAQGPAGADGAQGPAGADGSGLVVYTAEDWGQVNTLLPWTNNNAAYELATTNSTLPEGDYMVVATSGFRYGTGAVDCWVNMDSYGHWGTMITVDVMGEHSTSLSGVVHVPAGGSTLSFSCYGDPATTNFDTRLTAVKVASVNPN